MEDKCYTVYMHVCPNNKKYIGITKQLPEKRWAKGLNYSNNKHFMNAIKKYKWENIKHEILFTNLTKKEAEEKEIKLISYYKSNNQKYGYNILKGGNVSDGLPKEIRQQIANKRKGKHLTEKQKNKIRNSLIGRKMSEEWKNKISKSLTGKKKNKNSIEKMRKTKIGKEPWNKGKKNIYSQETLNKMSENSKKMWKNKEYREKNCKKVLCIEMNMVFESISSAKKYFNIKSTSHISECCNGKLKSCGKYNGKKLHWKYVN